MKDADEFQREFLVGDTLAGTNLRPLGVLGARVDPTESQGTTAVYDRHSYDAEKSAALLKWKRRLSAIVSGGVNEEKVIALRA